MNDFQENFRQFVTDNKTHLFLLTPCYNSICHTGYVSSLTNTIALCHDYGIKITVEFCNNDSLVPRARNNMVARAMGNPTMTHIFFIDSDIVWQPIDVFKLLFANKYIIGGVYPLKKIMWERLTESNILENWRKKKESPFVGEGVSEDTLFQNCLLDYNYRMLEGTTVLKVEKNVAEVRHIATGFMMIRREVIELMQSAYPSTLYHDDNGYLKESEHEHAYALFDCAVEKNEFYSEDWLFCERWRAMGGNIYAYVNIDLTHIGVHEFKGSFIRSIL